MTCSVHAFPWTFPAYVGFAGRTWSLVNLDISARLRGFEMRILTRCVKPMPPRYRLKTNSQKQATSRRRLAHRLTRVLG